MEVLLVDFEVFSEFSDAFSEDGNLNFWRAGIMFVSSELSDDGLFFVFLDHVVEKPPEKKSLSSQAQSTSRNAQCP